MPTSHLVVIQWWSCFLPWAYGIKNRQDGSLQWTSPSPQALKVTVSPKPMLGQWSVLIFREMLSLLASNPLESLLSPTVSEVFLERSCVDLFWVEELLLVKKKPSPYAHPFITPWHPLLFDLGTRVHSGGKSEHLDDYYFSFFHHFNWLYWIQLN